MQGLAFAMMDAEPVIARAKAERRRYRRVRVDLPGRLFVPADGREARCTIQDLSPGGAAIRCEMAPEAGAAVVVYVDGFGRFEGVVARPGGVTPFGVAFHCTPSKRERTAEQLTLFLNKSLVDESVLRRHYEQLIGSLVDACLGDGAEMDKLLRRYDEHRKNALG